MKVNSFMPQYMVDFKCIGSKCTDTCCAGWDINIDKETFEHYEKSNGDLKELINSKYKKNEYSHDFFNEGFMILKNESRCPFLNENNLCNIHGNIGEEHLCITCTNYPRVFNIVDDIYEKSGLTSCEEICFKALLNKDKMEFVEVEDEIDEEKVEIRRIIDTESFEKENSLLEYFWDFRVITINILQNREYIIEERLNILKYVYRKIDELYKENNIEEIEELIENINNAEVNFDKFKGWDFKEDIDFYTLLNSKEILDNIKGIRLKKCVDEYSNGLNYVCDIDNIDHYIKENTSLENDLKNYDYIFENYLVNVVFKDLIPFNKGNNLEDSICELINLYKIIKSYIIGIALNSQNQVSEKDVIRVIQALSKDTEHNKVYSKIRNMRF